MCLKELANLVRRDALKVLRRRRALLPPLERVLKTYKHQWCTERLAGLDGRSRSEGWGNYRKAGGTRVSRKLREANKRYELSLSESKVTSQQVGVIPACTKGTPEGLRAQ